MSGSQSAFDLIIHNGLVLDGLGLVRDCATYEEPRLRAEGIRKVFVNGRQAWPLPKASPGCWGRFLPG